MYEVPCLDQFGNTISNLFQWDVDQKINIVVEGSPDGYLKNAPEVHFSNIGRKDALIVRSTVKNNSIITASVPNILLQDAYPLLVYVYLTDKTDVSSQKTILYSEIPVRKRPKPSDHLYVENITRIKAEDIKREIEKSTNDARTNAINSINSTKDAAIASVNKTKTDAVKVITDTKNAAVATVNNKRDEFIDAGNQLVATATQIKNNTQKKYEDTFNVANSTQQTIENNVNIMIAQNGLTSKVVNDGNGNVTLSILINN